MKKTVSSLPKHEIYNALALNGWSVRRAAVVLGCNRSTLHRLMKKIGLRNMKARPFLTREYLVDLMEKNNRRVVDVAAITGHNRSQIFKCLKKWGIPRASREQKWKRADKTHCIRGHQFHEKNTYIDAEGFKVCRKCMADGALKRYHSKKGVKNVQPVRHEPAAANLPHLHGSSHDNGAVQVRRSGSSDSFTEREPSVPYTGQQGSRGNGASVPENHP